MINFVNLNTLIFEICKKKRVGIKELVTETSEAKKNLFIDIKIDFYRLTFLNVIRIKDIFQRITKDRLQLILQ